jgi:hypothetical protein
MGLGRRRWPQMFRMELGEGAPIYRAAARFIEESGAASH